MFVNSLDGADAELTCGAVKHSGYGRELGNLGIQEFVNKKADSQRAYRCAGLNSKDIQ